MKAYITISRKGQKFQVKRDLTEEEKSNTYRRGKTITETKDTTQAKVISPRLAVYKAEPQTTYTDGLWHVIHIPTGLVIAACTHDVIKDVKSTFESSKWTLKGDNTLVMVEGNFTFEMTCNIRYTIHEKGI